MSQVINHKLNVISTLVEFSSISRVELLSESDKVSLLRISLHDMKVWKTRGCIDVVIEIVGSIIHQHVGTDTDMKMDIHSPHYVCAKAPARVNIGQGFLLQYTNNMKPQGVCGSYIKLIQWSQR